jgi:hypothetical protein
MESGTPVLVEARSKAGRKRLGSGHRLAVVALCAGSDRDEIAVAGPPACAESLSPLRFALASAVAVRTSVTAKRKSKESRRLTPDGILSLAPTVFSAGESSGAGRNREDVGQMDEPESEPVGAEPLRLELDLG